MTAPSAAMSSTLRSKSVTFSRNPRPELVVVPLEPDRKCNQLGAKTARAVEQENLGAGPRRRYQPLAERIEIEQKLATWPCQHDVPVSELSVPAHGRGCSGRATTAHPHFNAPVIAHHQWIDAQKRQLLEQAGHIGQDTGERLSGGFARFFMESLGTVHCIESRQSIDQDLGTRVFPAVPTEVIELARLVRAKGTAHILASNVSPEITGVVAARAFTIVPAQGGAKLFLAPVRIGRATEHAYELGDGGEPRACRQSAAPLCEPAPQPLASAQPLAT